MYAEAPSSRQAARSKPNAFAFLLGLRGCLAVSLLSVLAVGVPSALAQVGARPDEPRRGATDVAAVDRSPEPRVTEHQEVRLVLVPAAVTDRRGRAVTDLTRDDFLLLEDYVPQDIKIFSAETTEHVSLAFLLDLSGSMRQVDKLDEAKEAIRYVVQALRPTDEVALIGFADQQVSWITEFTADRKRFLERLEVQRAYGQTALYDAVAATPTLVDERTTGRKAIILITDGVDNASSINVFTAQQLARRVDVPIYAIGFSNVSPEVQQKSGYSPGLQILNLLSGETGGLLFTVQDPDDLKEAVTRIDEELRHGYLIGYYPTRRLWDGSFRRILLHVVDRDKLNVRTRRGYYATP